MKITILQGSARKKGNTAKVLGWVEEEFVVWNGGTADPRYD